MKRLFSVVMLAVIALTSCEKDNYHYNNELEPGYGLLSFAGADITVSEEVETRANVNDFFIWVYAVDDNGSETVVKLNKSEGSTVDYITYGAMPTEGIKLPAGKYKLVAQSATAVPDYGTTPVYGAEREFVIVAGKTTDLSKDENGNPTPIVCTLWQQVKVKVAYNELFIQHLAGEGIATVKINEKAKMSFKVKGDGSSKTPTYIDEDPGYLKVTEEDTDASGEVILQVEFEGVMKVKNDDGTYTNKKQKMRAAIPGVKAGQYRKIQFDMAEDKDGNANFTITIDGFVEDVPLTENIDVTEGSLGDDPNKPQGDGGIKLICTAGPDETTMAAWNAAEDKSAMPINVTGFTDLKFTAEVPNKVFEFYVKITSTNADFADTVRKVLDPTGTVEDPKLLLTSNAQRDIITMFQTTVGLGFPYSEDVCNEDEIYFDLANALEPLSDAAFAGVHTFAMYVTDNQGCTKTINLVLDTTTPKTE
ncbi:MAG: DUF4493 domain-containing protein [Rikenellaceae bacterium]|nr:DUF4493 domain-containing protein [Rikenellaceae bacterium]